MPRLVLATRNPHKAEEFDELLRPWTVVPLPDNVDLPPETGTTFAENALGKARAAAAGTGRTSFGDDSGIVADALDGAPGVRSARFAGEDATHGENLALFLERVPVGSALAYVCAIAYVDPATRTEHVVEGRCTGTMAAEPRGDGGFGYDPVFLPDDADVARGRTMAELTPAEKASISHRGIAARALLELLRGQA
ncbi:non-canonical purine NTP pyrophosphatase [Patulibacter minatonensis]|uniref:non-canonical purine NTP pyrophosphatase n=1 Tax=Patulibacter minatonensis TaxID=298163 RepID=UPI00047D496B|nr:non-canonical purine NTP pyrophosphatase [Patulibacter minatonensis]